MGCNKQPMTLAVAVVVLVAFACFGAVAAVEEAGAPAPAPSMTSAGEALGVPALLASMVSLLAWLV